MSTIAPLQAGQKLDDYRIDELVAESTATSTWRATDLRDGRQVALKLLKPEAEADAGLADAFRREEEVGAMLHHPRVRRTLQPGERSRPYQIMEWIPGRLLRQLIAEEGKLSPDRAVRISAQILEALHYIHGRGIVHRDLKPENVMVCASDAVKLIDFGIASRGAAEVSAGQGTPDYIAPEQIKGNSGDHRADLYALGVMMYEMLTGSLPFTGPSPLAAMNARLAFAPRPPRDLEPNISPELQEVISRALEITPRKRYGTAREFLYDLHHPEKVRVRERPLAIAPRNAVAMRKALLSGVLILIPLLICAVIVFLQGP